MKALMRPFAVVALPFAFAACGTLPASAPEAPTTKPADIPASIAAPSGSTLAVTLKGAGLQNYECRVKADGAGGYDWVFVAPEAVLRNPDGVLVGKHYAGPSWEYGDGSKVTGKVLAMAPAPRAGNLPWLLLQGTAAAAPGTLAGVTYVQRANTAGGTAPSDPCSASMIGTKKAVRYSADYLFYKS